MSININSLKNLFFFSIVFSVIIRVAFYLYTLQNTELYFHGDQVEYIALGRMLYDQFQFDETFYTSRMPLYPAFISLILKFYNNLNFVILIQHLVGLSFIIIAYNIGLIYSKEIAFISGILCSLNLNFITHANFFLTETLFGLFFFIFLFFSIHFLKFFKIKFLLFSGIFLGLSVLVRPLVIYLPIVFLIFLVFAKYNFKKKFLAIFVFLITFYATIFPWMFHNYKLHGHFALTTSVASNVSGWYLPHIDQFEKKINLSEARIQSNNAWKNYKKDLKPEVIEDYFELDKEAKKYFFNTIKEYRVTSIVQAWFWGGMKNILSPPFVDFATLFKINHSSFYDTPGNSFVKQAFNFIFFNSNIYYSFILIFGILLIIIFRFVQLFGIFHYFKKDKYLLLFLISIIIYFLFVSGPIGYAKYRFPLEIIFILLTSKGIFYFDQLKKQNGNKNNL